MLLNAVMLIYDLVINVHGAISFIHVYNVMDTPQISQHISRIFRTSICFLSTLLIHVTVEISVCL